jgi:geranylgeranyl reductase family protein
LIYDVAIVGAGPAGASAAYHLEKLGYNIALIDKAEFPRSKPCAGVLPPRIYSELEIPDNVKERDLDGYRIYSPSGSMLESAFSSKGLIVRRDKFDHFLIERLNADVINLKVSNLVKHKDSIELFDDKSSILAKIVVGADGVNSLVRKLSGISDSKDVAFAIQYEISLSKEKIDANIGNWFEVYYTIPWGYGWISPLHDTIKIGIGGTSEDFKRYNKRTLEEFLKHKIINQKISDGEIQGVEAHRIPMNGPLNTLTAERTILVGDAGGFVFPGTGEGIYYAIKSGRIAAEVIHEASRAERFDSESLDGLYSKKLEKNGLTSLREVDFVENVLSDPDKAEKYVKRLRKLSLK